MVRSGLLFRAVFALAMLMAYDAAAAPEINGLGNSGWGKLNSAIDTTPRRLKALVGLNYARARNVFGSGDVLQLQGLNLRFGYDLTRSWGFGLGAAVQGVADSQFYSGGAGAATMFDAYGTYHRMVDDTWGLGILLRLQLPSGFSGLGVVASDLALRLEGLATWRASDFFSATFTLGYIYDRRDRLIATFNPIQRLLFDAGPANRLLIGAGVAGWLPRIPWVSPGWFAELFGEWSTATGPLGVPDSPIGVGIGLRASPWQLPDLLVSVGCDFAVTGSVAAGSPYPGLFPWNLFLQVVLQLGADHTEEPPPLHSRPLPLCEVTPTEPPPCKVTPPHAPCPPRALAARGDPHAQIDPNAWVDPNARFAPDPPSPSPSLSATPAPGIDPNATPSGQVMLSGFVLDLEGKPAPGAVLTLPQYPDVRFVTNPTAGYFRMPPLNCNGDNILEVVFSAKNMIHQTHRFACTQPVLPAYTAKLEYGRDVNIGEVTFNVRVHGRVPQEKVWVHLRRGRQRSVHEVEVGGVLQLRLRTGVHHATIVAAGTEKRTERFVLGANEHVVFNIELSPAPNSGKP